MRCVFADVAVRAEMYGGGGARVIRETQKNRKFNHLIGVFFEAKLLDHMVNQFSYLILQERRRVQLVTLIIKQTERRRVKLVTLIIKQTSGTFLMRANISRCSRPVILGNRASN